jgi:hypothetical protein
MRAIVKMERATMATFGDFNKQPAIQELYAEQRRRRQARRKPSEPFVAAAVVPIAPAQRPPPAPARRPRQRHQRQVLVTSAEKPCRCGSAEFVIGSGKGPHAAKLCCASCGRFQRWVGQQELEGA